MALNKLTTQLLVATLGCTIPGLVGVSSPAVAFDFQLQGTFSPASSNTAFSGYSNFSGTFSVPEPVSTYTGPITAFSVTFTPTYTLAGPFGTFPSTATSGYEGAVGTGGRQLSFRDGNAIQFSLNFSPAPATPGGLSFSSGSISLNPNIFLPPGVENSLSVESATITPVPAPAPIGGVLFLPGLGYWLLRKKI